MPEVSVEMDVAGELDLVLGDTIVWNVQGVRVPTRVTSFREVQWASFQPNFFVVFEPEALRAAPKQFVLIANAPGDSAVMALQSAVVRSHPTVSSIDLSLIQRTVGDVVGKVTMAIRFLAVLSVCLALPVLFSAVSATRRQRVREGVLLKTLGASRAQIGRILLSEYAILGLLGSAAGLALSVFAGWALTRWVFEVPFAPALATIAILCAATSALAMAIGFFTGREVFRQTPMAALRDT
jgi:putative ABC transport system permease protein